MKKEQRAAIAAETLAILEAGSYDTPAGVTVTIEDELEACLDATKYFSPDTLLQLLEQELAVPSEGLRTKIEVVNETTLEGIAALVAQGQAEAAAAGVQARKKKYESSKRNNDLGIAALNFASARNPGGGFLNGAQAQEESLARSSALYVSQQQAMIFYERHRADDSLLYSDAMILTPDCPIIRNDAGDLLDEPVLATFITSPAPNAGAIATNQPENLPKIEATLAKRAELVLALAATYGHQKLVLGAWGCGVFGNQQTMVANVFAQLLLGRWQGRFSHVRFSVYDRAEPPETFQAFVDAFKATS